jgi:hypothetical protein
MNDKEIDFETLAKVGALSIACAYAVGILTTNIYLFGIGVSDFSLFKPKAIFTGAIVLGTLALIAFAPMQVIGALVDKEKPAFKGLAKPMRNRKLYVFAVKLLAPLLLTVVACATIPHVKIQDKLILSEKLFIFKFTQHTTGRNVEASSPLVALSYGLQLYIAALFCGALGIEAIRRFIRAKVKNSFPGMSEAWPKFVMLAAGSLLSIA